MRRWLIPALIVALALNAWVSLTARQTVTEWSGPWLMNTSGDHLIDGGNFLLNAAGNASYTVGEMFLDDPGGGNKTCSSAGGCEIVFMAAGSNVLANASTEVRVGLQDVASGLPDGTFDVYKALIGGTDTITNSVLNRKAMSSGTKTVAHGDVVALGFSMVSLGGVDAVTAERVGVAIAPTGTTGWGRPYGVQNGAQVSTPIAATIIFDDNSLGWLHHTALYHPINVAPAAITYNSTSTPDEYIGTISFPAPVQVVGCGTRVASIGGADSFEQIFYSAPYGTPVAERTRAIAGSAETGGNGWIEFLFAPYEVAANTKVGCATRPTSANSINWEYRNMTSGFDDLKGAQPFASTQMASRTDQTGAFVETQVYDLPHVVFWVNGTSSGTGGGGAYTFGSLWLPAWLLRRPF